MLEQRHIYYLLPFSLLAIVFSETIVKLVKGWFTYEGSHGLLIFAFGIYIFWIKRHEIANLSAMPAPWSGTALSVLGGLGYMAGRFTGTWSLEGISLIVTILGIALLLGGKRVLVFSALPVGYMIFMFPFFDELLGGISIHLQLITAWIASNMLKMFGMPAYLTEQYITLPHVNLEVAKACNGINHITALLAITIPFSFFVHRSWHKRATLIVSAVAIGIILNGVRVASIGIITSFQKGGPLHGPSDVFYVSFIFFAGLLIQFTISYLIGQDKMQSVNSENSDEKVRHKEDGSALYKKEAFSIVLALGILSLIELGLVFCKPVPAQLKEPLNSFPISIGQFESKPLSDKNGPFRGLKTDVELFRKYNKSDSNNEMYLYVGYLPVQNYEIKITDYPDEKVLLLSEITEIPDGSKQGKIKRAIWNGEGGRKTVYFWYEIDGKIVTSRVQAKIATLLQAAQKQRTNAAIVMIASESKVSEDGPMKEDIEFMKSIMPTINAYLEPSIR